MFDCGVANDMPKVMHMVVCIVLIPSFCFTSSVCFGSFCLASPETGVAFRLSYTSICSSFCFLEVDVCVYPSLCLLCSLSDILAPHDSSNISSTSTSVLPGFPNTRKLTKARSRNMDGLAEDESCRFRLPKSVQEEDSSLVQSNP